MNRFRAAAVAGLAAFVIAFVIGNSPADAFVTFESGQVRPLAMSPDGNRLFVCNTPDNRVEIFDIGIDGLTHVTSVPVGLEPVAVAARTNTEIWVVNHLSDSVSIVDLTDIAAPRVTRSLTVGDEPRDIVFGGPAFDHAYITTAHRGQNIPFDPQLTTPGVGRADVWVFDANDLGSSFGGDEETILTLFGDTPRPLAVSPDGTRVYAGVFLSGNQTMTLGEGMVPNGGEPNGLPDPPTNHAGDARPEVGLIVKFNGAQWVDELGRDWSGQVKFTLPDYDVFSINSAMDPPIVTGGAPGLRFAHVGTTLFNMAINPADGKLFVTNLEAFNDVRFEGPGTYADTTVRGHLVESRITVIDPIAQTVTPRHLNKHITYDDIFDPAPNATNDKSLAFPLGMAFNAAGTKLYVAALGSSKIGVYVPSEIENNTFTPNVANQIEVSGGGPTGVVLDEDNARLYVLTRFDNSVSVIDTAINTEESHISLHNPEPANVVAGRPFLYDARLTSARGDQACASCHIFGDFDALAWDLGNPDDDKVANPLQSTIGPLFGLDPAFHPMKGPMTTQSLRGMDNHGAMHWRGDRNGGSAGSSQPNGGVYNEQAAFKKFNPAFVGLIGRSEQLTTSQMQSFTDFVLDVMYPPNPNRALDNQLDADQQAAQTLYFGRNTDTVFNCNGCHTFNRNGNSGVAHPGFFGTDGHNSFENETQMMKIAQLRNLYQKVGMFGMATEPFVNPGNNGPQGDQIRGFGYLHDGSTDTIFRFLQATVFNNQSPTSGFAAGAAGDVERRQMEKLILAFDSNHRPIVGQQATLSSTSSGDADTRVDLMIARAAAGECDVIAKGVVGGEERGWFYQGSHQFSSDRDSEGLIAEATLRGYADTPGQELTFTAVPTGEGEREGIDRDQDGYLDADEVDGGSDPANASSLPCIDTTGGQIFRKASLQESKGKLKITADLTLANAFNGGIISVEAEDGDGPIFSGVVDAASLVPNNAGTMYKYKAPTGTHGITKLSIKANSGTPGLYRVKIQTDQAWTAPGADETIATTLVTIQVIDECFEGPATKVY